LNSLTSKAHDVKRYYRTQSISAFEALLPHKIYLDNLGKMLFPKHSNQVNNILEKNTILEKILIKENPL